jgi:hypothetical protein
MTEIFSIRCGLYFSTGTVGQRERARGPLNSFSIAGAVSLRPHTTAYINLDVATCCEVEQELENQWLHSTALYHFTTVGHICLQWILLKSADYLITCLKHVILHFK